MVEPTLLMAMKIDNLLQRNSHGIIPVNTVTQEENKTNPHYGSRGYSKWLQPVMANCLPTWVQIKRKLQILACRLCSYLHSYPRWCPPIQYNCLCEIGFPDALHVF